ncbi:MAG: YkvA family protein [Pirellulales bacterium]
MDRMQNEQTMTDGIGSEQNRRVPAMPPRKRKPKHRRHREPMPQPPKAMWPAYLMVAGAVLYFLMPIDVVPDFILGLGQLDDIAVFYGAYRQWKSRKDGNSTPQKFRPRSDERTRRDDYGRPHEPVPPARFYDMAPQEKPGFFARLFKAVTYLLTGGGL